MKIAVCDDEKEIRESIKNYIMRFCPEAQVTLFSCGEALCSSAESFDVIFLDIKMRGIDGMDAASALREKGCGAAIIFVTALEEYVYRAFDVGAFHYLLKPIDPAKFYEVLRKAAELPASGSCPKEGKSVIVKNGKSHIRIYFSDMVFAEVFNRKLVIHTSDGETECYGRMSELEEQAGECFFRPHRGFLINLAYVTGYTASEVSLGKVRVPMAKKKYPEFVKRYLDFLKKGI